MTSTTTRRTRLPAAARKRQILDVALPLFADRGFHPTSMNDLATAAGVTKPVLYQHFRSKRDLYVELLAEVGGSLRETIAQAATGAQTPREQLLHGFTAYFAFVAEEHDGFQVLFGGGTRRDEEFARAASEVENEIATTVAAFIEVDGLDLAGRRLLAHAIVGLAEGTCRQWLRSGATEPPDELARRVTDLAWGGLRGITP